MKNKKNISLIEINGQQSFFGYDNVFFRTINLPKKQRLTNLCKKFNLKQVVKNKNFYLPFFLIRD